MTANGHLGVMSVLTHNHTISRRQIPELKPPIVPERNLAELALQEGWKVLFRRRDVINPNSDSQCFFLVLDGLVKLRVVNSASKESILDILGPGEFFGPAETRLSGEQFSLSPLDEIETDAVALTAGSVQRIHAGAVIRLFENHPSAARDLSRQYIAKNKRLQTRLGRLLYRSSLGKLGGLLTELGERFGNQAHDGITIGFRLTHQELASMIGVKRETVSDCMGWLEEQEIVRLSRGTMQLLKLGELAKLR